MTEQPAIEPRPLTNLYTPPALRVTITFPDTARLASIDVEVSDSTSPTGLVAADYIGQVVSEALAAATSNVRTLSLAPATTNLLAQIRQDVAQ